MRLYTARVAVSTARVPVSSLRVMSLPTLLCVSGFFLLFLTQVSPQHNCEFPASAHSHDLNACGRSSYLASFLSDVSFCNCPPDLDGRFDTWENGTRTERIVLYSNHESASTRGRILLCSRHCFVTNSEEGLGFGVIISALVTTGTYESNGQ